MFSVSAWLKSSTGGADPDPDCKLEDLEDILTGPQPGVGGVSEQDGGYELDVNTAIAKLHQQILTNAAAGRQAAKVVESAPQQAAGPCESDCATNSGVGSLLPVSSPAREPQPQAQPCTSESATQCSTAASSGSPSLAKTIIEDHYHASAPTDDGSIGAIERTVPLSRTLSLNDSIVEDYTPPNKTTPDGTSSPPKHHSSWMPQLNLPSLPTLSMPKLPTLPALPAMPVPQLPKLPTHEQLATYFHSTAQLSHMGALEYTLLGVSAAGAAAGTVVAGPVGLAAGALLGGSGYAYRWYTGLGGSQGVGSSGGPSSGQGVCDGGGDEAGEGMLLGEQQQQQQQQAATGSNAGMQQQEQQQQEQQERQEPPTTLSAAGESVPQGQQDRQLQP